MTVVAGVTDAENSVLSVTCTNKTYVIITTTPTDLFITVSLTGNITVECTISDSNGGTLARSISVGEQAGQ